MHPDHGGLCDCHRPDPKSEVAVREVFIDRDGDEIEVSEEGDGAVLVSVADNTVRLDGPGVELLVNALLRARERSARR